MFKRRKNRGVPRDLALMIDAMRGLMADNAGVAAHIPDDIRRFISATDDPGQRDYLSRAAAELNPYDCGDTDSLVRALLAHIGARAHWFNEGIPPVIPHEAGFGYETTRRVIEAVNDGVLPVVALDGGPEQWRLPLFAVLAELHRQERVAGNLLSLEADWAIEEAAKEAAHRAFVAGFGPVSLEDVNQAWPVGTRLTTVWATELTDYPGYSDHGHSDDTWYATVQGWTRDSIVLLSSTSDTPYEELLDGRLERDEHGRVWFRWTEDGRPNKAFTIFTNPEESR